MIPLAAINQLAAVYRGRGRNEAYLEFAQEHFLDWLRQERLLEDEAVVFKGGTAIRKFVLGTEGRFSTKARGPSMRSSVAWIRSQCTARYWDACSGDRLRPWRRICL